MKPSRTAELRHEFANALHAYLNSHDDGPLDTAKNIGLQAIAAGVNACELVALHRDLLAASLLERDSERSGHVAEDLRLLCETCSALRSCCPGNVELQNTCRTLLREQGHDLHPDRHSFGPLRVRERVRSGTHTKLKILLADTQVLVREALRVFLEQQTFTIVAEAGDGPEAVFLAAQHRPDVVVMEIMLPLLNGIDAARQILTSAKSMPIIMLAAHNNDRHAVEAFQAGVRGYVLKTQAGAALVEAIGEVINGGTYISPGVSRAIVERLNVRGNGEADILTGRERHVVQLIAESKTTKDIAEILGVSVKTAESHRNHILSKLDLHDAAGVVRYAIRRGLIQP